MYVRAQVPGGASSPPPPPPPHGHVYSGQPTKSLTNAPPPPPSRRAIRIAITNQRQKALGVGVLQARAKKGTSIGERIKRIEDRLYKVTVARATGRGLLCSRRDCLVFS